MIVYGTPCPAHLSPAWRGVAPMSYHRVKSPFMVYVDGRPRILRAGAIVSSDDPVYKSHESAFESIDASVEQATSAPGEVRNVVIPQPEDDPDDEPEVDDLDEYHVGGGWYEIEGERYRGSAAAREALKGA